MGERLIIRYGKKVMEKTPKKIFQRCYPNTPFIILLPLIILLVGCGEIDNFKILTPTSKPVNYMELNVTNSSINVTVEAKIDFNNGTFYIIYPDSAIVFSNTTNLIIDSGAYSAVQIFSENSKKPDLMIVTNSNSDKANGVPRVVRALKPKSIFDNGLPNSQREEYLKYSDRMGISYNRVIKSHSLMQGNLHIKFFVPFDRESGFFNVADWNSLVVQVNDLLYMSDCYGDCEKTVNTKCQAIVLANHGKCPTNSIDFILDSEAKIIIGDEYCGNLTDLEYFDVKFRKTGIAPIVLKEEKDG